MTRVDESEAVEVNEPKILEVANNSESQTDKSKSEDMQGEVPSDEEKNSAEQEEVQIDEEKNSAEQEDVQIDASKND